ncbi:MAG TPA: hypothetical protein ENG83_15185 [Nitrospirae bacterium]|nr:CO-responsive transcriptional regulator RcoM [bacterium BMS3Abin06]HDH13513.1 hypothetical protein [Nitrospirota bacterium]HDZ01047.1 hypothetical protein [Nitrospirota bacterium]
MKNDGLNGHLSIGVVILSLGHRVIGINEYASRVLQINPSQIGKSVYEYHPPKVHSRLKGLLKKACRPADDFSSPIIMNVLNRVLAVNICRIESGDASLRHFLIMTFIDVTGQKDAEINKKIETAEIRKIPVYNGSSYLFLNIPSIYLIKSEGNYCRVFTESEQYYLRVTLSEIEKKYTGEKLFKVHRSFLVNLDNVHRIIQNVKGQNIIDFNKKDIPLVPVARRRSNDLNKTLKVIKGHVQ